MSPSSKRSIKWAARNLTPCGNCSARQVRCNVSEPFSRTLCQNCKEDGLIECPPYVSRATARRRQGRRKFKNTSAPATPGSLQDSDPTENTVASTNQHSSSADTPLEHARLIHSHPDITNNTVASPELMFANVANAPQVLVFQRLNWFSFPEGSVAENPEINFNNF
ncbi:hypothetical protein BD410DRAFT_844730 [Rickenella mellea]|uniref:Zn(2)-C6 fungal-type domain-containing protein n=1 Tax=Rickenella mellea TaxID=50990 RepID=A0A4Y7PKU9_9AGAM|nr:hypothetical protein BD410DRAFT_844730 [Rickenella mellea]